MPGFVLTGTPGAGKTAILRALEREGHRVVEEAATDVIALEQALGWPEPERDPRFLEKIVGLQRARRWRARLIRGRRSSSTARRCARSPWPGTRA
jgi:predicted ATPase